MSRGRMIANMSLSPEFYSVVNKMARKKKISRSELLRRSLRQYIASERRWRLIRAWGKETAKKLGMKGEPDVERIVDEYRKERDKGL